MVRVCPQPCSQLATAVLFIIIGVIQLLVGVILLRSKYANLLSGPDFMTAITNIGTGCIYGLAASVWKINKSHSMKSTARKNVLAALLTSVITINITTVIVLLLGDGNKLLTLHLENNKSQTVDFTSEILAYAYITSVCSPITCIVVAIVALSGRCFEICREETTEKQEDSVKDYSYNWVFDSKKGDLKIINDFTQTTSGSDSLSTSKGSMFSEKGSLDRRRSVLSLKNIPSPLSMWKQKREKMLRDVVESQKHPVFDSSLQNPNFSGNSSQKLIPRIKQTSLMKNQKQDNVNKSKSFYFNNTNHSKMCRSILKRSSSGPDPRKMIFEHTKTIRDYNLGISHKSEGVGEKRNADLFKDNRENFDYDMKNKRKKVPEHLKNNASEHEHGIDKGSKSNKRCLNLPEDYENDAYPIDPLVSALKSETLKELKEKMQQILPGASIAIIKLSDSSQGEMEQFFVNGNESGTSTRKSSDSSDVFSNETDADISRNNISSDRPLFSDASSSDLRPVRHSESSYPDGAFRNKVIDPGLSIISKIRSKSLDFSRDEPEIKSRSQYKEIINSSSMTIIQNRSINHQLGSPKTRSIKQKDKKCNFSRKMSSMASITEIPFEEQDDNGYEQDSAFVTCDFDNRSRDIDENCNIKMNMSPSNRRIMSLKNARRKSSISSSNLLKRMWSTAASESKMNVADLVMDEDSLIGLSEEELIARTLRIRSLRKTVEQRLKKKVEEERQANKFKECPVYL